MQVKDLQLKRALHIALLILLMNVVGMGKMYAQSFTVDDLNYQVNNDGISVTVTGHVDGQSATGSLVIPETVENNGSIYSVTTIGSNAFYGCSGFNGNLTIPNSVTSIGDDAFNSCSGFSTITVLAETPPTLGSDVFYNLDTSLPVYVPCSSISDYQSSAGWNEFTNYQPATTCASGEITVTVNPTEGGTVTGTGYYEGGTTCTLTATPNEGYLFLKWSKNGEIVGTDPTYSFIVDGDVDLVANFAEEGDVCFITFELHDSYGDGYNGNYLVVTDENGFSWQLTVVSGSLAVYNLPFTTGSHITLGWISGEFIDECSFIVSYSNGNMIYHGENIEESFSYEFDVDCNSAPIGNIVFADPNVKAICIANWDTDGDGELSYAEAAAVTDLGQVFRGKTEITSFEELQYFTGLTTIAENAFEYCSNLSGSLYIPDSVSSIGWRAFFGCSGFNGNLTIPNSVTTIGYDAFRNCSGFTGSLTIGNSVTTIGDHAFAHCSGFNGNLTIPNSVTTIGVNAFYACSGFTGSLTIGNSVTTIGDYAFAHCSGFNGNLTIPNSVTTIGNGAFLFCSGFSELMMFRTDPPTLGNRAFDESDFPIYVLYESLNVYKTATNWSSYENRIFPMAYTTIPGYGEGDGNYRFIASPLVENTAPTTVVNMITETPYDLYRFDQSEDLEWRNYEYPENTQDFMLVNGQGYLYANAEVVNLVFKGEFNEDETKEVELAYDANADFAGWNLVGNPFPVSAYADRSYYVMNEDGTAIEPVAVSMGTVIPFCTGVMVKSDNTGETVTFSKTAPEAAVNQGVLQIAVAQANQRGASTGSATVDKAIVSFNADDRLEKFVFNEDNATLSIPQGGKDFAIANAEKMGEMPLNFKAAKNGEYTITVNPEAVEMDYLHLIDNMTGNDIDLLASPSYSFDAKTTDYASRFRLVFVASSVFGDENGDDEAFAFYSNGNYIVTNEGEATLQIIDELGHILSSEHISGCVSKAIQTTPGIYVLRLLDGNNVRTQKIVVR